MGFVRVIANTVASLVGMVVTLAGVGVFFAGVFTILKGNVATGILLIIISILAVAVATVMGKYARGDYD